MGDGASPRPEQPDHSNFAVVFPAFLGDNYVHPSRERRGQNVSPRTTQNVKRAPSWICRFGKAEVNASGVLGVTVPPLDRLGRIPCTLKVVNPGSNPKSGPTSLFTLAKFVRFAMLNPSAVNRRFAFTPSLWVQLRRMSK